MLAAFRAYSSQIQEPFVTDVITLLNAIDGSWYITSGFRTYSEQAAEWDKGRDAMGGIVDASQVVTHAPPGDSAHEYGLAVDVTLVVNGKDCWDFSHELWVALVEAIDAHPRLHSGSHFTPPDFPHIEATDWHRKAGWT